MDLIEYKNTSTHIPSSAEIAITKAGVIRFNALAVRELDLKPGDKVAFYQDRKQPVDWYFKAGKEGAPLRETNSGSLICNFSLPARNMLKQFSKDKLKVRVATTPVDGGYYAILTRGI